jgi:hypothetical protein
VSAATPVGTPSGPAPLERFRMRPYWQLLAVIGVFAAWPVPIVYLASVVADLNHCTIVETGATPCIISGVDRGGVLYDMASLVQASFVTLPLGVTLGFVWLCVLVLNAMAWRRKRLGVPDATRMRPNFTYYGLALAAILGIGYATLVGLLPAPLLLLVSFVAIFWLFSFVFALVSTVRDKAKPQAKAK